MRAQIDSTVSALVPGQAGAATAVTAESQAATAGYVESDIEALPPRWARVVRIVLLAGGDLLALVSAGALGYFLWALPVRGQPARVYLELLALAPFFLLAFGAAGLYPGFGLGAIETIRRLSRRTSFMFVVLAAMSFVFRVPHHHARIAFAISWALSLMLLPLCRYLVLFLARRRWWWPEPVLLLGAGGRVRETILSLGHALTVGYRAIGIVTHEERWQGRSIDGIRVLGGPERIPEIARGGVRVVFLMEPEGVTATAVVDGLQEHFRHVVLVRGYGEVPVEGVELRNLGGFLGLEFENQLLRWRNRALKRSLDLVAGTLLLFLTLPVILACALLIKVSSRGSPFYYQVREGYLGEKFKVWKLRTMYADAEERLERYLAANPEARRQWEERFKLKNDPRVLPVIGSLLRRFSLDELPQLWQVVRGEMSLVGPRPFPEYHLLKYSRSHRELRQRVRPGLTGLWQVMTRSDGGVEEQQGYDSYYVRNWSIWMDCYILARTGFVVLHGRGAY